jgi:hypothetical protein
LNISDEEYDRIMKEVRRDPRYCRIVTLEELENAPENMHFGGKMIQFPDRVEIVPDDELRDRCFDTTINHGEEPESSQK